MVTTSAASPAAALSPFGSPAAAPARTERGQPAEATAASAGVRPAACTILTPSGALLARALARPRPASLPADTYAIELSEVEPQGALEPLLRTNSQVVLRTQHDAQLVLHIDHIIGPRERRTYYLQTLEA